MAIHFQSIVPVLRIFDIPKAEQFYNHYLGFAIDWDHRFGENTPLYRQISRSGLVLHLSEHHGDGSPGANVRVTMTGIVEYHKELANKDYRYMKPGLEDGVGEGSREFSIIDPFGNKITFCQETATERPIRGGS